MDHAEYYRNYRRKKEGKPDYDEADMETCLICQKRFVFLGSHVRQGHKMYMADYKKEFDLDTKKGRTHGQFKELKRKTNKGIKNLKIGKKFWFKKGDHSAGKYERSKETKERLRVQGLKIGKLYGGNRLELKS